MLVTSKSEWPIADSNAVFYLSGCNVTPIDWAQYGRENIFYQNLPRVELRILF